MPCFFVRNTIFRVRRWCPNPKPFKTYETPTLLGLYMLRCWTCVVSDTVTTLTLNYVILSYYRLCWRVSVRVWCSCFIVQNFSKQLLMWFFRRNKKPDSIEIDRGANWPTSDNFGRFLKFFKLPIHLEFFWPHGFFS